MDRGLPLKKSVALVIIGVIAFIVYLYFFVGFEGLLEVLKDVNLSECLRQPLIIDYVGKPAVRFLLSSIKITTYTVPYGPAIFATLFEHCQ